MCPHNPLVQRGAGFWWLAGILFLGGCASVVPEALEQQVDREVQFPDLQRDPGRYRGRTVVLGGRIAGLHPAGALMELEVTQLPLTERGDRPRLAARSDGGFVVLHEGPLDPAIYRLGRPLTVVGVVQGSRLSPRQERPEPMIAPRYLHLWPDATSFSPASFFSHPPWHPWHHHRFRHGLFHRHFCD